MLVLRGGAGRRRGLAGCSMGFGDEMMGFRDEMAFPGIGISGGGSEEGASETFITRSSGDGGTTVEDVGAAFTDFGTTFKDNGAMIGGLILARTDVDRFCDSFGGRAGASAYECRLEASMESTVVRD